VDDFPHLLPCLRCLQYPFEECFPIQFTPVCRSPFRKGGFQLPVGSIVAFAESRLLDCGTITDRAGRLHGYSSSGLLLTSQSGCCLMCPVLRIVIAGSFLRARPRICRISSLVSWTTFPLCCCSELEQVCTSPLFVNGKYARVLVSHDVQWVHVS